MKKKKKKWDSYFGGVAPTFWLGLLLFTKRESRTPTFKILVRTLVFLTNTRSIGSWGVIRKMSISSDGKRDIYLGLCELVVCSVVAQSIPVKTILTSKIDHDLTECAC